MKTSQDARLEELLKSLSAEEKRIFALLLENSKKGADSAANDNILQKIPEKSALIDAWIKYLALMH